MRLRESQVTIKTEIDLGQILFHPNLTIEVELDDVKRRCEDCIGLVSILDKVNWILDWKTFLEKYIQENRFDQPRTNLTYFMVEENVVTDVINQMNSIRGEQLQTFSKFLSYSMQITNITPEQYKRMIAPWVEITLKGLSLHLTILQNTKAMLTSAQGNKITPFLFDASHVKILQNMLNKKKANVKAVALINPYLKIPRQLVDLHVKANQNKIEIFCTFGQYSRRISHLLQLYPAFFKISEKSIVGLIPGDAFIAQNETNQYYLSREELKTCFKETYCDFILRPVPRSS